MSKKTDTLVLNPEGHLPDFGAIAPDLDDGAKLEAMPWWKHWTGLLDQGREAEANAYMNSRTQRDLYQSKAREYERREEEWKKSFRKRKR
jgi:hypothetical protein